MTLAPGEHVCDEPRRVPLHDDHVFAGARMSPFAGWTMPLAYEGTVAEHRAVRSTAGVFDVSHMGQVRVAGPDAMADMRRLLVGRFDRIAEPGTALYALLVTEGATILDDVIAYRIAPDEVLVVCNAANTTRVFERLTDDCSPGTEVEDVSEAWTMLALQGPAALDVLAALGCDQQDAAPFTFTEASILGHGCMVAMTGYTGERGCELLVPPSGVRAMWQALLADQRVTPCGLGARDTLRLEACFPLHGSDIDAAHDVLTSSLGWVVDWSETTCIAYDELVRLKAEGTARRLVPLRATGRGIPRAGCTVHDEDGSVIGEVTSGTMGPTVGAGIALARVDTAHADVGSVVTVDVRGRPVLAEVVRRPFLTAG